MADPLDEEKEKKKRAIFNGMSPKHRQKILKNMGYENWDPFQEPRDPIDLREQKVEQMASVLFRQFILDCEIKDHSDEYTQAVKEISKGIIKAEERYKAMYDFCCWYEKTKGDSFPDDSRYQEKT
jgi:hypothetical protein